MKLSKLISGDKVYCPLCHKYFKQCRTNQFTLTKDMQCAVYCDWCTYSKLSTTIEKVIRESLVITIAYSFIDGEGLFRFSHHRSYLVFSNAQRVFDTY